MSQMGDKTTPEIDLAVERYKQGKCPGCGKQSGERRGLEYRSRSADLYCHTCKRRWPIELDIKTLQDELSLLKAPQTDLPSFPGPDPSVHQEESARRGVAGKFGRFFRRIMLRHSWHFLVHNRLHHREEVDGDANGPPANHVR